MANPLQRAVLRRQVTYLAIIVGLFTLSMFWRGKIPLPSAIADLNRASELNQARRTDQVALVRPASNSFHKVTDWIASRTIAAQAAPDALDLAASDHGSADISGTAVRLLLTGSRGWATTALWWKAMDFQKRNEFHKLEQTVNAVMMLQPHFISPWLYQSWNMTYNVSVENDRLTDTFYYIARGIELLAKGERLNRDSPDMRYNLAFYIQNKFSVSDKVLTLRSLFNVACIKPSDRNPDSLRDRTTRVIDMDKFRSFVRQNPVLCRRLREKLNYTQPEQIVRFLEDNQRVPTRYDKDRQDILLPVEDRFPVLPPSFAEGPDEPNENTPELDDTFDAFMAARAWFSYSLVVVPPPNSDPSAFPLKTRADRFKYRMPKAPMLIIYRQGAPRSQSYLSEYLQKDGWFDGNTKWYPDSKADTPGERWFPDAGEGAQGIGLQTTASSRDAWARAYTMWSLHGERSGLIVPQDKLERLREESAAVPQDDKIAMFTDEQLETLGLKRSNLRARDFLTAYRRNLVTTNFEYFLRTSEAEQAPETVAARQLLFEAENVRLAGKRDPAAIRQYAEALSAWRQVLLRFKAFHRQDTTEEHSYETSLNLMFMLEKSPELQARVRADVLAIQALIPMAGDGGEQGPVHVELARNLAEKDANLRVASFDPRVQARVDTLFSQKVEDADLIKDWPDVLKWKRALAIEVMERAAAGKPVTEAERAKAADDSALRTKALEVLLAARLKPLAAAGWPDILNARDEIARDVVLREFSWLPDYTEPFKDVNNQWVRPDMVIVVRQRLNLSRPKPAAAEPAPDVKR
ncbi:hypothetical protein BH11PLA2_BH11PLA2_30140 [soil metagenome]